MDTLILPKLLLIAGTGRNSGKTTLACQLIKKYSSLYPVIAIKISPHFHPEEHSGHPIMDTKHIYIAEETDMLKLKDSNKMLAAGAEKSYFVMTDQDHIGIAFSEVLKQCNDHDFLICESGGLRNYIVPGLFVFMQHKNITENKHETELYKKLADCLITFDGEKTNYNIDEIIISENRWKLQKLLQ
jgi:molybdopterin-guanine dinucleotide biosynthesis protein